MCSATVASSGGRERGAEARASIYLDLRRQALRQTRRLTPRLTHSCGRIRALLRPEPSTCVCSDQPIRGPAVQALGAYFFFALLLLLLSVSSSRSSVIVGGFDSEVIVRPI